MTTITVQGDYVLASGQTLIGSDLAALLVRPLNGIGGTVTVSGDILMPGPGGDASNLSSPQAIAIDFPTAAEGVLHVTSTAHLVVSAGQEPGVAMGIIGGPWSPQVINDGAITISGLDAAYGMRLGARQDDATPDLMNTGTITVKANADAAGVYMDSGGDIENSGTIAVTGGGHVAGISVNYLLGARYAPTSFSNSGLIQASSTVLHTSAAVAISTPFGGAIVNSGTLQGDTALTLVGAPAGAGPWEVRNTGQMIGKVSLSNSAEHFVNSGSITGDVTLGAGDDTYDGRLGSATGMVAGGDGADTLMGGAGFDYLQGNAGADSESGGAGDDWVVGGQGNDWISGGEGDDIVYANLGDDTLSGDAGNDWVRGGQGNDVLSGGAGNDFMSGDKGDDTISGGAGADIFHSFGDAGVDRVTDFNAAEGDRVQLDPGTTYAAAQVGADTVITMTGGAVMTLVGVSLSSLPAGWIFVG